ncbi:holo-ACP synthase [Paenibacillus profundus]|uniref:Holo-[acyl-carrier-protein] synthase n=1 Tax=Paenibacillus profundus TaxID=1173085 RepID=A0ABS8Y9W4_9BACL|nr:holo-ACP synthase [Paenibacillus profundus]MCE5168663.1 holo-ACP synthase [Paenibacillus profundus]
MIYGIGHDILELDRVTRLLNGKSKDRFLQRVLTPAELAVLKQRETRMAEWVAGRFAVKEAVVKAFGTGIGRTIGFLDIEVLPDAHGKPHACVSEAAWNRLGLPSDSYHIHVSISHQPSLASAQAIVEHRQRAARSGDDSSAPAAL